MRNTGLIKLLVTPLIFAFVAADARGIDKVDSATVATILNAAGWIGVPVDSVVQVDQLASSVVSARVTGLKLIPPPGLPRIKQLSPEIGKLPELTSLTLTGNALSELPAKLAGLLKLRHLNISSNAFNSLPDILGNIPSLQILDASCNQIDSVPSFIWNLPRLEILRLQANRISSISPIPLNAKDFVKIKEFNLIANRIESLPAEIASLVTLEQFYLDSNELTTLPLSIVSLSMQQFRIGVVSNRICTLTDYSLIAWLTRHQLGKEWRATQRCDDSGYAAIATDIATGTIVSFISAYKPTPQEAALAANNAVTVGPASNSNLPGTDPSGKTVLKAVAISLNPIFKNKVNTLQITIPFKEPAFSGIDASHLFIYFLDSAKWHYFGGTVNADKKTVSVKSGKEGIYALVREGGKTITEPNTFSSRIPAISLVKAPSALVLRFGRRPPSGISVFFLTLTGRRIARVAVEQPEVNQAIAVAIPAVLSGKPGIVAVNDGNETVTRLIVLP